MHSRKPPTEGTVAGLAKVGLRLAFVAICAAPLAGCATETVSNYGNGSGMSCLDDSPHCVAQRQAALRNLVGRSDRHWVRDQAGVDAYASGVRLFAFKKKKKDLTCDELARARHEADGAERVLRGPDAKRLTPAQVARGSMFAAEVSRELSKEHGRRCRRG
ncbi:MAG: hypothetical protein KDJ37_01225 [Hyphomicrobiaceae bacterium]|nr:hypothetical protein [Hyphomicrobiaceae bacterium]